MSNALAIATVTEALAEIVTSGLGGANVTGAHVSTLPPDSSRGLPSPGVNIYLYQVTPNAALRNADIPTRAADGTLLRRPQTALDLHYLLTFYGNEAELEQQRLLGAVARTLHAQPVVPRSTIAFVESTYTFLHGADLDQQPELVRVTPINFSLEELSKLWSFLLKIDYVLSVAYVASVVLIETDDPIPPPALPVLSPTLSASPLAAPVITSIASAAGPNAAIRPNSTVVVTGTNFLAPQAGSTTTASIGGISRTPLSVTSTQLTAILPATLAAGTQTMQIIQSLMLGVPPSPHPGAGFQSDLATFVLHPLIHQISPGVYDITVTPTHSPPGDAVIVKLEPIVREGQRAVLELMNVAQPTAVHLFDGGTIPVDTGTVSFPVTGLLAGHYLVRVLVDGADTPLVLDPSGTPVAPVISL